MNTSDRLRDVLALESYRVVLTQAVSSPEISEALDKIGFNTDLINEGSGLRICWLSISGIKEIQAY